MTLCEKDGEQKNEKMFRFSTDYFDFLLKLPKKNAILYSIMGVSGAYISKVFDGNGVFADTPVYKYFCCKNRLWCKSPGRIRRLIQ